MAIKHTVKSSKAHVRFKNHIISLIANARRQTPNGGKPVVPPCDRDLWLQRIEEAKAKHAESLRQNNIVDVQITWSCEDPDSPVRVNVPEDEAKIVMDLVSE